MQISFTFPAFLFLTFTAIYCCDVGAPLAHAQQNILHLTASPTSWHTPKEVSTRIANIAAGHSIVCQATAATYSFPQCTIPQQPAPRSLHVKNTTPITILFTIDTRMPNR